MMKNLKMKLSLLFRNMPECKEKTKMTREELRDYVEEQRNLGIIPYHVYSTLIDGIDTLEQEPILDKIRAEIRKKMKFNSFNEGYVSYDDITEVLDKYKAESEE